MADIARGIKDEITRLYSVDRQKTYFKRIDERTKEKTSADIMRLSKAFEIKGGCETINNSRIKLFLLSKGYGFVSPHNGKLYFWVDGAPGGQLGQTYEYTRYTFSNAYTGASGDYLEIGEDGILWKNDPMLCGVLPILDRYNLMLSHCELSIYMALINSRVQNIGLAGRDAEAKAFEMVFDSIEDGDIKAIVDRNLLNKTATLPNMGQTDLIKDLIELEQYLKASKWNELGLNANWNAKRESLSNSENLMNTDSIMPLMESIFDSWKESIDLINEKYSEYLDAPFALEWSNAWKVNEEQQKDRIENPNGNEPTEPNGDGRGGRRA